MSSLLAGAALAGTEADEGVSSIMQGSGPFSSIQEIKNYDAANQGTQRTVTFVDGKVVQDLFGFGPAEVTEYFLCSDQKYRAVCSDPYSRATTWGGSLFALFQGADTQIYVDNVLYQANTAPWKQSVYITTCYGDTSPVLWGPYAYYRVTFWQTQSGTLINRSCTTP
ncbi:hypothetical protein [Archangium lipolyticum]|uniref:hypothetical protein n=1 Tax=Archangium lipolyticum TaxID=2970465 RepID=UPI002149A666|nr:hypothetical protein [Archangium lipolyticum]